jgi:type IV pilus biogenesis protein CpaD/CtpE
LADDRNLTVPEDLLGWHSNPKYDASDIDGVIKKWRQVDQ